MTDDDIAWLEMGEIARRIHARELSATEVAQAMLRRIGRLDPGLHAYALVTPELALAQAREADAVLAVGTRFLIQNGQWGIDANLKVVRIDIDPEEHDLFRKPDVAIVGDSAAQLRALLAALPRHNRHRPSRAAEIDFVTKHNLMKQPMVVINKAG
ncbi:MAG: hypothetical protein NTW15_05950, partial [Burkholderiales bacterium]|nr:hypothetical protein [Burkholderiales bacterium]